jgi:uncharacterized protein
MNMKKWVPIVGGSALAVTSLITYFSHQMMYIKKKEEKFILNRDQQRKLCSLTDFDALPKEEVWVNSPFGYRIKAVFVEPHETKWYVVFCHGVTECKWSSIKYMNLFLQRGFNAVIYDHRRHGESGGKTTSYGHYEKYDLQAVIHTLLRKRGPDVRFGIHGESMGAVTMLLYAGMFEDCAQFYIADCPFSDFEEQLLYRMKKEYKVSSRLLLSLTDRLLRLRDRYSVKDVSPRRIVDRISAPVLFIHSEKDDYILPSMTKELYERKKGPKQLFLATDGVHAEALFKNREAYEQAIDQFLHTYVFSTSVES